MLVKIAAQWRVDRTAVLPSPGQQTLGTLLAASHPKGSRRGVSHPRSQDNLDQTAKPPAHRWEPSAAVPRSSGVAGGTKVLVVGCTRSGLDRTGMAASSNLMRG